jgi:glycosyltransferase involved in cell wall biosynthesis
MDDIGQKIRENNQGPSTQIPLRWIVSQIGAREHYAVPRAFHARGRLRMFYTDAWASALVRCSGSPLVLRAFSDRFHPELPDRQVAAFTIRTFLESFHWARRQGSRAIYQEYVRAGMAFAQRVTNHLSRQLLDPRADAFFGFFTGCLETLEFLRERGILTFVDQADAGRVHYQLVSAEAQKWPGWQEMPAEVPDFYFERLAREWQTASLVVVNSHWSQSALVHQGVSPDKIIVVPPAYERTVEAKPRPVKRDGPLTVLWVGNVVLGKGIQYLIEAAKTLAGTNIRFTIAGTIGITEKALAAAPSNMNFLGTISRQAVGGLYCQSDLFVLATISDGFALTQIEAMSYGLPVIATPNCGRVVTPGVDGLIVPAYDATALAEAITRVNADRSLLAEMSRQALEKSKQFSLASYADRVEAAAQAALQQAPGAGYQ